MQITSNPEARIAGQLEEYYNLRSLTLEVDRMPIDVRLDHYDDAGSAAPTRREGAGDHEGSIFVGAGKLLTLQKRKRSMMGRGDDNARTVLAKVQGWLQRQLHIGSQLAEDNPYVEGWTNSCLQESSWPHLQVVRYEGCLLAGQMLVNTRGGHIAGSGGGRDNSWVSVEWRIGERTRCSVCRVVGLYHISAAVDASLIPLRVCLVDRYGPAGGFDPATAVKTINVDQPTKVSINPTRDKRQNVHAWGMV